MPDVNIGALPNLADVQDDALLAVEFEGEAYHLTGAQWKAFARQAVSAYSEAAAKSATDAAAAQTAAEQAKTDAEKAKTTAETAAQSASDNASATQTAKDTAVSAADRAQGYTTNPPKPSEDGTVWMLWDGTQYVTTDIPARSEVLPKIWTAKFDTHGLVGEVILLSNLSGPEEATLESVNSGDFLISTKDGGILRISYVSDSYWGQADTPCAGMDAVIYGYLPEYPATLTVGFSEDCDFICDGVDDQVEIMEALNALPPLGGKIFFEGGTYNLSGRIYVSDALGDIELYCDIDDPAHFMGNYQGGVWAGMFFLLKAERVTIRNLILESTVTDCGLELDTLARGGIVENCRFINLKEALQTYNVLGNAVLDVENCRFEGTTTTSIISRFANVRNCFFSGGIYAVALEVNGKDCMVQNCVMLDVDYGVFPKQTGAVISGNVIQARINPVPVSADRGAVVAGNTFVGVNVTETEGNTFVGNGFVA